MKQRWYLPKTWVIGLIRLYQQCVPRSMRGACRFQPTCSAYAVEALQRHGLIVGLGLAVWRILRCNPLCRGGCRREREPIIDGIPSLNRFCECYKKFFEACYPKMEEIAVKLQRQFR